MNKKIQGILLFLTATLIFAVSDSIGKYLTASLSVVFIVWVRYSLQLVFMLFFVAPMVGQDIVITHKPGLMIIRALFQVGSALFVFLAFQTLPQAETTALVFFAPLIVAILAGPLLGETVRAKNWFSTLLGFCGVLLIVRPGGAMFGMGVFYALGSALCYALYQILTRKLAVSEPPIRQLFYLAFVGSIASSFILPFYWSGQLPTLVEAALLILLGALGSTAHFLLIRAFHQTDASRLSPLLYIQLIWASLLGWFAFGHFPDSYSIAGMIIIGCSGLILTVKLPFLTKRF